MEFYATGVVMFAVSWLAVQYFIFLLMLCFPFSFLLHASPSVSRNIVLYDQVSGKHSFPRVQNFWVLITTCHCGIYVGASGVIHALPPHVVWYMSMCSLNIGCCKPAFLGTNLYSFSINKNKKQLKLMWLS